MKRRLLVVSLCLALAPAGAISASVRFDLGQDVGAYTRFLIYPHLSNGFAAMDKGDGKTAIAEFRRARELAPRNVQVALYLANAYRRFGQAGRGEAILAEQRRYTPNDPRLAPARVVAVKATDCSRARSASCRALAGQDALRDGRLDIAEGQLDDAGFAASAAGIVLRRDIAQRAIHLRDWRRADAQLSRLDADGLMTPAERDQWFEVMLARGKWKEASLLPGVGRVDRPRQQLAIAQEISRRNDVASLAAYVGGRTPAFDGPADEMQWLSLLDRASHAKRGVLLDYRPRFAANRSKYAQMVLPALLADDAPSAQRLLDALPPEAFRQARFDLAVAGGRLGEAQQQAFALSAGSHDSLLLDTLSYRLLQAGGDAQAARLLLAAYPFGSGAGPLFDRLANLAMKHPDLIPPADRLRLQQPLATPSLREWQAGVLGSLRDCAGVMRVLGDMDARYGADRWTQLGDCYRADKPGLAQYAYAQADRRRKDGGGARSLAYQAFENHDPGAALAAWASVPQASLTSDDALAAARTALAADRADLARRWLDLYASRAAAQDAAYWWLRALADEASDPVASRVAVERAIAVRPDARYYGLLAKLQANAGQAPEAIASLQKVVALDPKDAQAHAALGYAYWNDGDASNARAQLEIAHAALPDDDTLVRQLAYANQRLGDYGQARRYARMEIDALQSGQDDDDAGDNASQGLDMRRLNEDLGRRWRFSADMLLGTHATSAANATDPAASYRSYVQFELAYRFGGAIAARDPDALVAYARVLAGSGESGGAMPTHAPTLGVGVRWKPLQNQVVYLALEQQEPLDDRTDRHSDTMLRASASFLGNGRYSDDWHPSGAGWLSQNLYLDAARYLRSEQSVLTAIYLAGIHRKIGAGQTIEPYTRLQFNGIQQPDGDGFDRDARAGLGIRWNLWGGQDHYTTYRHRISAALEFQHAFDTYLVDRNGMFLILGGSW